MQRCAVPADAEDEQANWRMNFLHKRSWVVVIEFRHPSSHPFATKSGNRDARASGIQILCKINEEIFRCALDENIDFTGAAETLARVETD